MACQRVLDVYPHPYTLHRALPLSVRHLQEATSGHRDRKHRCNNCTPSRNNERYVLQAGSFRSNADADRRRAELILQGFDATVQSVKLENGNSWHRVMIGPYNNQNTMHRAQDQLAANGIETLPIKVKQ